MELCSLDCGHVTSTRSWVKKDDGYPVMMLGHERKRTSADNSSIILARRSRESTYWILPAASQDGGSRTASRPSPGSGFVSTSTSATYVAGNNTLQVPSADARLPVAVCVFLHDLHNELAFHE
jgi:hypothetical protein